MDIKVKDHKDIVRDSTNGAIIASDFNELMAYRKRKADLLKERDREKEIATLKNEIADLKAIMLEMRSLLNQSK